jgi:hypothetical protein
MFVKCSFCPELCFPDEVQKCSCEEIACFKCIVGQGVTSAGRRHHHLVCELRIDYEKDISYLKKYIETLVKDKNDITRRYDNIMKELGKLF